MDWLQVDAMDKALVSALLVALLVALVTRRRGGSFRRLLGQVGFWAFFTLLLFSLTKLPSGVSLTLLGLLMFAGLRTYFFVAPMRGGDRFAILGSYLSVPVALWFTYTGASGFLATVPIVIFLIFPALLTGSAEREGMLDSLGRLLLGVLVFVFCAAHLGFLARNEQLELFGVFAIAAELPQRLVARPGPGAGLGRAARRYPRRCRDRDRPRLLARTPGVVCGRGGRRPCRCSGSSSASRWAASSPDRCCATWGWRRIATGAASFSSERFRRSTPHPSSSTI